MPFTFFYFQEDGGKLGNELTLFQNSSPALQEGFQIQLWDYNQVRNKQRADVLGIKKFPTYLILNKDGVVLQTQDLEEAKKYLTENLTTMKINFCYLLKDNTEEDAAYSFFLKMCSA